MRANCTRHLRSPQCLQASMQMIPFEGICSLTFRSAINLAFESFNWAIFLGRCWVITQGLQNKEST